MIQSVKKIIAREGLIILSILLLAGVSWIINAWLHDIRLKYERSATEWEIVSTKNKQITDLQKALLEGGKIKESTKDIVLDTSLHFLFHGIKVQFPYNTPNDIMNKTLKRDYSHIDNVHYYMLQDKPTDYTFQRDKDYTNIKKYYDKNGNPVFDSIIYKVDFSDVNLFILFFAYPIYLLFRFIIWAVKTLIKSS